MAQARPEHHIEVLDLPEGVVQAVCSCGWRSVLFGEDKAQGTMDTLQQARDAADLHEWEISLLEP